MSPQQEAAKSLLPKVQRIVAASKTVSGLMGGLENSSITRLYQGVVAA